MEQTVSVEQGKTYTLSLYYTPRHPNNQRTNPVEVLINDVVVMSLNTEGLKAWKKYEITHVATANSLTLTLRAIGASDSHGGLIDNISLTETGISDAPNLITNHSFEEGTDFNEGSRKWKYYTSIPGWTSVDNEIIDQLEIQTGAVGGVDAQDGITKTELDAFKRNIKLYQDVATENGKKYVLRFYYSPRVRNNADTNRGEVYFNNQKISDLNGTQRGWVEIIKVLDSDTALSRLEFHGLGEEDGRGAFIDNVSLKEVNCELPSDITFKPSIEDLFTRANVGVSYSSDSYGTSMMFQGANSRSNKPIKKVTWTYGSTVFDGWTFKTYMNDRRGNTVNVELQDVDGFTVTEQMSVSFTDHCDQIPTGIFGNCLRTDDIALDGNFIPVDLSSFSFYLDSNDDIEDNMTSRNIYLVQESDQKSFDITEYVTISGKRFSFEPLSLAAIGDELNLNSNFHIELYGDFNVMTTFSESESQDSRSQSFKIGSSSLNISFDEPVTQVSVISANAPYGKVEVGSFGSQISLQNLPPGGYVVEVENEENLGMASFKVGAFEEINLSFLLQSKNPNAFNRLALAESYNLTRSDINPLQNNTVSSQSIARLNDTVILPQVVYQHNFRVDQLTCDAPNLTPEENIEPLDNAYLESRFIQNFEDLRKRYPSSTAPGGLPEPLLEIIKSQISGTDEFKSTIQLPEDKLIDNGEDGEGVSVEPGKTYSFFIFGEHPLLHKARNVFEYEFDERCCIRSVEVASQEAAENEWQEAQDLYELFLNDGRPETNAPLPPPVEEIYQRIFDEDSARCSDFTKDREDVWALFEEFSDDYEVTLKYTITGEANGEEQEPVEKEVVFSAKDFLAENGGLEAASIKWIFNEAEGDGWLLKQPEPISVPGYFENPKLTIEFVTPLPDNIVEGADILDFQNFVAYISAGVVEENNLPTVNTFIDSNEKDKRVDAKNKSIHGRLLAFDKKLFPVHTDSGGPDHTYQLGTLNELEVELEVQTSSLESYTVKGIWGYANYNNVRYPDNDGFRLTENVNLTGDDKIKFTFEWSTYFNNNVQIPLLDSHNEPIDLEFGLILEDEENPGVELFGPEKAKLTVMPMFNMLNAGKLGYLGNPAKYSTPNYTHGIRNLARVFRNMMNSSLHTDGLFKYNDGSLPFGGKVSGHSEDGAHSDGSGLDMRYPGQDNDVWDQSRTPPGTKRIHGYDKYKTLVNYLIIKRKTKEIKDLYNDQLPEELQSNDITQETHRGETVSFIIDFCQQNSSSIAECPSLLEISQYSYSGVPFSPKQVLNIDQVLNHIDALVSYIQEVRLGISTFMGFNAALVDDLLVESGSGYTGRMSGESGVPSSSFSKNWHEVLLVNGKFPDGVNAPDLGSWAYGSNDSNKINFVSDEVHLSHIHVNVKR